MPVGLEKKKTLGHKPRVNRFGGGKEIRTPDLLHAMQTLYQLSYTPTI